MRVIESAVECGDGVSIEREQPSNTFRSMAAFMKLGDIKGEFQADELRGTFNALNETTNVRPSKGESISIVHPAFKTGYDTGPIGSPVELNSLDVGPVNKTADKGWWTVDSADFRDSELDALNETTNFDDRGYSPISGEGVFKPQDIDTRGSVIVGDNHFKPGRGGDSLTGEGRPISSYRCFVGDSSAITTDTSPDSGYVDEDVDGFMKLGDVKGGDAITGEGRPTKIWTSGSGTYFEDRKNQLEGQAFEFGRNQLEGQAFLREQRSAVRGDGDNEGWNCTCVPDSLFTETFEPAAGMNSFGESLNPVLEIGATAGPGGSTFMTGQFEMPTDNVGGNAGPGGSTY